MKTLTHLQIVRAAGLRLNQTVVVTLEGMVADHNARYSEQFKETVQYHLDLDKKFERPIFWAWTMQCPGILTVDYLGKTEELNKEREAIAAAPELVNGEEVEIAGRKYTVRIVGDYSDPIHFIPVK